MPYHPFIEDTDQGNRTFLTRQTNESEYGLKMSKDFHVSGVSTFTGAVEFDGGIVGPVQITNGILDDDGDIGSAGQVLSSTGSGTNWINASDQSAANATNVGITLNTDDADQWLVFAGANSGNNALRVNNTIRVNPGRSFVGIGTEDPVEQLHIHQVGTNAPILRVQATNTNPELDLVSASNGTAKIKFSDDADAAGSILYDHGHNKMKFMIGSTTCFWVSPNAHFRLFEALEDKDGNQGTAGQVLSSTGSQVDWISQSTIAAGSAAGLTGTPDITVANITCEGDIGHSNAIYLGNGASLTSLNADNISSGTVADARIPNLAAGKITSGTFADARIPNLAASKITSGTFDAGRIPSLAATKITSGTLDAARIPNLAATKITSGTLDAARIPNLAASKITSGTIDDARLPDSITSTCDNALSLGGTLANVYLKNTGASIGGTGLLITGGGLRLNDGQNLSWGTDQDFKLRYNNSTGDVEGDMSNGMTELVLRDTAGLGAAARFTFVRSSGNFTATGDVTAFSDIKIKTNIEPITGALDKISQINGVTYDRTDIDTGVRYAGVIAQEVEKVLPEVVRTTDDVKTVAYGNMNALLIEAIKELKAEIEELKKKI